jgi:hypothetical protein
MTTGLDVDESDWPIVLVRTPVEPSIENTQRLLDATDRLFAKKTPFALVIDARRSRFPGAVVRRMLAEYQRDHEDEFRRYVVADANVVSSPMLRGVVTAVNWLAPPTHPVRTFESVGEALVWAREQLARQASSG